MVQRYGLRSCSHGWWLDRCLPVSSPILVNSIHRYCGGQTQLNNLVSLASVDYAYISQSLSNQSVYLFTQLGALKERFAASSYAAAIDPDMIPQICDDKKHETKVCEEWEDCPPPPKKEDGSNCYDDPEFALDAMVTNMWETGTIWGEILANMFQNTLEAWAKLFHKFLTILLFLEIPFVCSL